jgi:hypothetical protein
VGLKPTEKKYFQKIDEVVTTTAQHIETQDRIKGVDALHHSGTKFPTIWLDN